MPYTKFYTIKIILWILRFEKTKDKTFKDIKPLLQKTFMNLDTALLAFGIASLTIGLTLLTVYSSFGPGSKNLIDPFEEDDD